MKLKFVKCSKCNKLVLSKVWGSVGDSYYQVEYVFHNSIKCVGVIKNDNT